MLHLMGNRFVMVSHKAKLPGRPTHKFHRKIYSTMRNYPPVKLVATTLLWVLRGDNDYINQGVNIITQ